MPFCVCMSGISIEILPDNSTILYLMAVYNLTFYVYAQLIVLQCYISKFFYMEF